MNLWSNFQSVLSNIPYAHYFGLFLTVSVHVMIVVTIIGSVSFVLNEIIDSKRSILSCLSAMCAIVTYFLAKALGVPIPEILLHATAENSTGFLLIAMAFFIPGLAGLFAAFLINKAAEQDTGVHKRVMILIATLALCIFTDVYASASEHSHVMDKQLAPNASFVIGISLFWILKKEKKQEKSGVL